MARVKVEVGFADDLLDRRQAMQTQLGFVHDHEPAVGVLGKEISFREEVQELEQLDGTGQPGQKGRLLGVLHFVSMRNKYQNLRTSYKTTWLSVR